MPMKTSGTTTANAAGARIREAKPAGLIPPRVCWESRLVRREIGGSRLAVFASHTVARAKGRRRQPGLRGNAHPDGGEQHRRRIQGQEDGRDDGERGDERPQQHAGSVAPMPQPAGDPDATQRIDHGFRVPLMLVVVRGRGRERFRFRHGQLRGVHDGAARIMSVLPDSVCFMNGNREPGPARGASQGRPTTAMVTLASPPPGGSLPGSSRRCDAVPVVDGASTRPGRDRAARTLIPRLKCWNSPNCRCPLEEWGYGHQ